LGFGSSPEAAQAPSRCIETLASQSLDSRGQTRPPFCSASLEVSTPTAFSNPEQRHEMAGFASPNRLRLQVLETSWRLHPPRASAGLISCRIRSWGHPSELCSSHAAVRCFQRRSPLGVPTAFRVLLHARIRHPTQLFKLRSSAQLSWASSPPGSYALSRCPGLHRSSPHAVHPIGRKRPNRLHSRVSLAESLANLSRDCRPSWGL